MVGQKYYISFSTCPFFHFYACICKRRLEHFDQQNYKYNIPDRTDVNYRLKMKEITSIREESYRPYRNQYHETIHKEY